MAASQPERTLVVEQEFGPELAGQRVGWTSFTTGEADSPWVGIHLAMATVAEEGAVLQYEARETDGKTEKTYWSGGPTPSTIGFIATAGVSFTYMPGYEDDRTFDMSVEGNGNHVSVRASDILRHGAAGYHREGEIDANRTWADNPQSLLADLKKIMTQNGVADRYATVYYSANMVFAHQSCRNYGSRMRDILPETAVLADPTMIDQTAQETEHATALVGALDEQLKADAEMKANLTVFSNIPATEIPAAFEVSRQLVAANEQTVIGAYKALKTATGVYLPVGYRPSGRTWPYMNATLPPTDKRSYGIELNALHEGDIERPLHELTREIAELERRREYAAQGLQVLRILGSAEKDVAASA